MHTTYQIIKSQEAFHLVKKGEGLIKSASTVAEMQRFVESLRK
jgi:hypothetical protein